MRVKMNMIKKSDKNNENIRILKEQNYYFKEEAHDRGNVSKNIFIPKKKTMIMGLFKLFISRADPGKACIFGPPMQEYGLTIETQNRGTLGNQKYRGSRKQGFYTNRVHLSVPTVILLPLLGSVNNIGFHIGISLMDPSDAAYHKPSHSRPPWSAWDPAAASVCLGGSGNQINPIHSLHNPRGPFSDSLRGWVSPAIG